jgi:hypothetical protein
MEKSAQTILTGNVCDDYVLSGPVTPPLAGVGMPKNLIKEFSLNPPKPVSELWHPEFRN